MLGRLSLHTDVIFVINRGKNLCLLRSLPSIKEPQSSRAGSCEHGDKFKHQFRGCTFSDKEMVSKQ